MSATIIYLADFRPARAIRLSWQRSGAKQWRLVAANGDVWATINPEGIGVRRGRGMFASPTVKATCLHPSMQGRHGEYWLLGSTVAQAKRRMERWLERHRGLVDDFEIAS